MINGIIEGLVEIEKIREELNRERELKIITLSVSDDIINAIKQKPKSKVTYSEQQKLNIRNKIDEEYSNKLSVYDEYKELVTITYTGEYDAETDILIPHFKEYRDRVEQHFTAKTDKLKVIETINKNKKILSDTDYIIIKSYEAKLSLSDSPYTQEYLDEVFYKRQTARDRINELESLLKTIEEDYVPSSLFDVQVF